MEIWRYIEVLRRPNKTLFFLKGNIEKKLDALTNISNDGHPTLIYFLTPFLKDSNKEIQNATCDTISHLLRKIESKNRFYLILNYCDISKTDIDFYETTFSKDRFVELLAISSLNKSGYVREKAVCKLSQSKKPRAIRFLIYRLADWVQPVRQAAIRGLEIFMTPDFIDTIVENLPIIEWLQKVERTDLSRVHKDVVDFITKSNRDYVLDNYSSYPDKLRLILANHISKTFSEDLTEIGKLIADKNFLIRKLALDHFDKLNPNDIEKLLSDKSAQVRLQTLYKLEDKSGFINIVMGFVADSSAPIRHFARITLKSKVSDFSAVYYQNLLNNEHVVGSLTGLAEMDAKCYSETAEKFLSDKKIKIRKTAFLALRKLDEGKAYKYGLENLNSEIKGVRNVVIDFLSTIPRGEVLEKARECFKTGDFEIKKSMLRLFNKVGGWTIIPDLMIGTVDNDETIRDLSFNYLQTWKARAVNLFTTPRKEDIERAREIFNFAFEIHKDNKLFITNPLNNLDFYFK